MEGNESLQRYLQKDSCHIHILNTLVFWSLPIVVEGVLNSWESTVRIHKKHERTEDGLSTIGYGVLTAQFFLEGIHRLFHIAECVRPVLLTQVYHGECIGRESLQGVLWCRVFQSNLIGTIGIGQGTVQVLLLA